MFSGFDQLIVLGQAAEQPGWVSLVAYAPVLLIFVLYFVLILRPNKRDQATRQAMLKSLKKNDHVVTASGIYGVVTNIQADSDEAIATIRVDETNNTKLRVRLSSISHVVGDEGSAGKETK